MGNTLLPTTTFVLPLLRALTPIQKWEALQRDSGGAGSLGRWLIWGLGIAIVLAAAVVLIVLAKQLLGKRSENKFKQLCRKMSLNPEQVRVLAQIVKLSGLPHSAGIFFSASAFQAGVEKLMYSTRVTSLSQDEREAICSTIGALADKLKFSDEDKSTPGQASTRKIPEATELTISQRSGEKPFKARLLASNWIEFTIETAEPIPAISGSSWLICYLDNGKSWEFECVVGQTNSQKTSIILLHSNRGRLLNKRRFPRIPTLKSARIALFPFAEETEAPEPNALEFKEATLIEIAGPGFKLRTKLRAEVGQKVLVVTEAEGKTIKGLAIVRHNSPSTEGQDEFEIAVELMGLDDTEMAVLLRETNEAQRQLERESESKSSETAQPLLASQEN